VIDLQAANNHESPDGVARRVLGLEKAIQYLNQFPQPWDKPLRARWTALRGVILPLNPLEGEEILHRTTRIYRITMALGGSNQNITPQTNAQIAIARMVAYDQIKENYLSHNLARHVAEAYECREHFTPEMQKAFDAAIDRFLPSRPSADPKAREETANFAAHLRNALNETRKDNPNKEPLTLRAHLVHAENRIDIDEEERAFHAGESFGVVIENRQVLGDAYERRIRALERKILRKKIPAGDDKKFLAQARLAQGALSTLPETGYDDLRQSLALASVAAISRIGDLSLANRYLFECEMLENVLGVVFKPEELPLMQKALAKLLPGTIPTKPDARTATVGRACKLSRLLENQHPAVAIDAALMTARLWRGVPGEEEDLHSLITTRLPALAAKPEATAPQKKEIARITTRHTGALRRRLGAATSKLETLTATMQTNDSWDLLARVKASEGALKAFEGGAKL
jgi:hypothetical protein